MGAKASQQRQWVTTVTGITGNWDTTSGGEKSADTNTYYDGGSKTGDVIAAPPVYSNVVLSRAYKRDRDASVIKSLRNSVGVNYFTITKTDTDTDLNANGGNKVVYSDALLVRVSEPDYDSNGDDVATYEIEFAVATVS